MQPTSPAAMSGGAAVKAENRGSWGGRTEAKLEEPRPRFSPGAKAEGLALTARGPQAPDKKEKLQPKAVIERRGCKPRKTKGSLPGASA